MRMIKTLLVAVSGLFVFYLLGLPLPFLFGPLFACLGAALLGQSLQGFGQISIGARTILGVAIGASITPGLVSELPALLQSLIFIPVFLLMVGAIGVIWFHHFWKLDFATAYYAAMPGGLQDMVIFGVEAGGDARALSLIHASRVLFIVTMTPLILTQFFGTSLGNSLGRSAGETPLLEIAFMVIAALVGWKGGVAIGLFGASILGPMIVTTLLSLAGVITFRPPSEAILLAQFFIGTGLGVHFVGITMRELRNFVLAGLGYVILLWVIAIGLISWLIPIGSRPITDILLAFAPGGQAEMTVLALVAGADLGFVIAHHILRIVLVITGAPLVAALFKYLAKPRN